MTILECGVSRNEVQMQEERFLATSSEIVTLQCSIFPAIAQLPHAESEAKPMYCCPCCWTQRCEHGLKGCRT